MKQIDPGKYRHRIDFTERQSTRDEFGELVGDWVTVRKGIWASKDPLLGNEYFNALTLESKVEIKFNMRYISGITNEMRIKHNDDVYEILSIVNVKGLNRELLCYCRLVR